jgi:2'-hydroxyisoflavone reductase
VQAALDAGHEVTLLNRGKTAPTLFPQCEHLIGDRTSDLTALDKRQFDAVIDACGYTPREVAFTANALADKVARYCFVSTVSVYADLSTGNDEASALALIDDPDTEVIDGRTYGALKALCEAQVQAVYGARALILRPGLVVGPLDYTERFTYWLARHAAPGLGNSLFAPGAPSDPLQFIDGRDFGRFAASALAQQLSGTFNVVTDPGSITSGQLMQACSAATSPRATPLELIWADAEFLQSQRIKPWTDLPAWMPAQGVTAGFALTSNSAARAAGLQTRPLAQTVAELYAWWKTLPSQTQANTKAGLQGEREQQALAAWRALQLSKSQ